MNKLLIHNQKTVLLDGHIFDVAEQFVFAPNIDTPDVDHYITNELEEGGDLRKKIFSTDIVFIKIALSENYLEYLGLRVAYHIRLSKSLAEKANLPIVLIGEESHDFLSRTTDLADILFTKGVYLIRDDKDAFEDCVKLFASGKIHPLVDEEAFLLKIRVAPPANYQTHHSITNEWSILRWADMASNINNEEREKLRENIKTTQTLYFKYLEAKSTAGETRQNFKQEKKKEVLAIPLSVKKNEKIYYIDDEQGKGWGTLFEKFIFKEHTAAGRFAYCDHFPKGETRANFLKRLKEKAAELIGQGYNVFIVDLRLCDADFENKQELCGFELIREIKRLNKGIQIVIFTASKKAENVNIAAELSVDRYVLKESPEHVMTRKDSYDLFKDFSKHVRDAINQSFLSAFYEQLQNIKGTTFFANATGANKKEFRASIVSNNGIPDKIFALTEGHNSLFLAEALLNAFKLIEKLTEIYFPGTTAYENANGVLVDIVRQTGTRLYADLEMVEGNFYFQTKTKQTIVDIKSNSAPLKDVTTLFKILAVLKLRYGIVDDKLKKLIELRYLRSNLAAHDTGNVNTEQRTISREDVLFLTDLLAEILV